MKFTWVGDSYQIVFDKKEKEILKKAGDIGEALSNMGFELGDDLFDTTRTLLDVEKPSEKGDNGTTVN